MGITVGHVLISLLGIGSGLVVVAGMLTGRRLDGWTAAFLGSTVATSLSGFAVAADRVLPSHVVGTISLVVLAAAVYARYRQELAGRWRAVYVVAAAVALYLNVFVGVIQSFLKVPALRALAPTQTEAPFVMAQAVVLATFAALAIAALVRFRPAPVASTRIRALSSSRM